MNYLIETECPHCGALNDISEYSDYELVPCWSCDKESEVSNGTLIDIDEKMIRS